MLSKLIKIVMRILLGKLREMGLNIIYGSNEKLILGT